MSRRSTARRARRTGARQPAPDTRTVRPGGWMERVRPGHVALALAVLHLVLVLLSLEARPHDGGDNAAYLGLARSLHENGTYRELWDPAARPHTQYPPGWPLILAAALAAGVKPWLGFKVLAGAFSALAVALSYLWARRVSTPGTALGVGLLLAAGTGVVYTGTWELSDPPFWAFTMLALWAFARLPGAPADGAARADQGAAPSTAAEGGAAEPTGGWRTLAPVALASAATLLAYATRSAGLPLVVAAAAWLAWRRRWRGLAVFAAFIAPFALFWWARGRAAGGAGYASFLWYVDPYRPGLGRVDAGGLLARIAANVAEYGGEHLSYLLAGLDRGGPAAVLGVAVTLLALVGWGMRARRPGLAELMLPLYVGLVLLWPRGWAAERFLLPVLPVLLVAAAEPVRWLACRTGRGGLPGAAAVAVVAVANLPPLTRQMEQAALCRAAVAPGTPFPCLAQPWSDFLALSQDVRGTLPPGSAVLSRKASLFWAYSGYPSRTYPFSADPDTLLAAAREAGARYVMVDYMDDIAPMYLAPALMQRLQAFCVVRGLGAGRATLMGILPGAEQMPNVRPLPGEDGTLRVQMPHCGPEFLAPPPPPG